MNRRSFFAGLATMVAMPAAILAGVPKAFAAFRSDVGHTPESGWTSSQGMRVSDGLGNEAALYLEATSSEERILFTDGTTITALFLDGRPACLLTSS